MKELLHAPGALGEAMLALVRAKRLGEPGLPARGEPLELEPTPWIETCAASLGIEAEAVESSYANLASTLAALGPALIQLPGGYLVVLGSSARTLRVLTPTHSRRRVALASVRAALSAHLRGQPAQHVDKWLAAARVPPRAAHAAREVLLAELVADRPIGGIWLLRSDPGTRFSRLLATRRVWPRALLFLGASALNVLLSIGAWVLLGAGALDGVVQPGWLIAWVLLSLSAIPVQTLGTWASGRLALDVAALLKQRLLCGALRLEPDVIRARGSGGLLAMVSESEAVEGAGLGGGLAVILAGWQLISAGAVLWLGAGGALHLALLVGWAALLVGWAVLFARRRADWTQQRFAMTGSFVENVIGYRTRVAQQPIEQHHLEEDGALERYLTTSRAMDKAGDLLSSVPARGWLSLALLGLLPAVLAGTSVKPLVIAIGGILLAQTAFTSLATSLSSLLGAAVSWRSIACLFHAAARRESTGLPEAALSRQVQPREPVLEARGVSFQYRDDAPPVLHDCTLSIAHGDRILLEGSSGGGKSTLALVLAGLRSPTRGLVLLRGIDRGTLGESTWQKRVASAPQFHENHILSGTLAFNLLMGRAWPASAADRQEADAICCDLGLGPLLDKMPSRLDQVVGEAGWQLSHGERSRLFLARALLQRADVVILDESFGALDPLTARRCVSSVLARAPALLVIAHP